MSTMPKQLGPYRIEALLGKGGMGAVFRALDVRLQRLVALKVPLGAARTKPKAKKRFLREAQAIATLNHANICPIYDVGEEHGYPYIAMAFVEGKPLHMLIRSDRLWAPKATATLIRTLARALNEAHSKGIVHRDLKPANIMIKANMDPVIMDFGLALRTDSEDSRLTQEGAQLGTPSYMAPEQLEGRVEDMGPSCDIYALGVVLFEMLTGELPYQGSLFQIIAQMLNAEQPSPTVLRPSSDPALAAICMKAMAKEPANRFLSMADFAQALDRYLASSPMEKPPEPTPVVPVHAEETHPPRAILATQVAEAVPPQETMSPNDRETKSNPRRAETRAPEIFETFGATIEHEPRPTPRQRKKKPDDKQLWILGGGLIVVALLIGFLFLRTKPSKVQVLLSDPRANVEVRIDGNLYPVRDLNEPFELPPGKHQLVVDGEIYQHMELEFTLEPGQELHLDVPLEFLIGVKKPPIKPVGNPPTPERGFVSVRLKEPKSETKVRVDGELVSEILYPSFAGMSVGNHRLIIEAPGFAPVERLVLVEKGRQSIIDVDLNRQLVRRIPIGKDKTILTGALSPDGTVFALGGSQGGTGFHQVWTLPDWKPHPRFPTALQGVTPISLDFSPKDHQLLGTGYQRGTSFEGFRKSHRTWNWMVNAGFSSSWFTQLASSESLGTIRCSPNGNNYAMVVSENNSLIAKFYSTRTFKESDRLKVMGTAPLPCMAFSSDGKWLAVASRNVGLGQPFGRLDQQIEVLEIATGRQLQVLRHHSKPVREITFSPDNSLLIAGGSDGQVVLWQTADWKIRSVLNDTPTSGIASISCHPDGRLLATSTSGVIRLWDTRTGKFIATITPSTGSQSGSIHPLIFHPDKVSLISVISSLRSLNDSTEAEIQVWDIRGYLP